MLLERVKGTIDHYDLLSSGDRLVVGVSGGMDSMVLLHVFTTFRNSFDLRLIAAHVDHGLRPEESQKEVELVERACAQWGVPLEIGRFDTKEFQRLRKCSLQEAARGLRFHFLEEVREKYGAQKIALGHHADDQVETMLLRLIRGAGLQGLKGMLPIRGGRVIRPLLEVWRHEIEEYALEHGVPFSVDSSNLKQDYLRNRIRLSLIPLLEEYRPNLKSILLKTSAILRVENDFLEGEAEKAYQSIVKKEGGALSFRYAAYRSLHPSIQWRFIQRMVGEMCREADEGRETFRILQKLSQPVPSFVLELPVGVYLEKRYETVLLRKGSVEPVPPFDVELNCPGRTFIKEIGRELVAEAMNWERGTNVPRASPDVAFLDYETLRCPLRVRNFRPGDRFWPLGSKGSQKLKEFFIDHKIPRYERPAVPLVISGERIVWVIGHRIDESVRVTDTTKKVLKISVI